MKLTKESKEAVRYNKEKYNQNNNLESKLCRLVIRSFKFDISTLILIVSNLAVIYYAIANHLRAVEVIQIYWLQSIIIGIFCFIRILSLRRFSTRGVTHNDKSVDATTSTKISMAFFFLFHYGWFHLIYAGFIGIFSLPSSEFKFLFVGGAIFFANHLLSFIFNFSDDREKVQNIGRVMIEPYARIIPMHLIILFGGIFLSFGIMNIPLLIVFSLLKTFVDVVTHNSYHFKDKL